MVILRCSISTTTSSSRSRDRDETSWRFLLGAVAWVVVAGVGVVFVAGVVGAVLRVGSRSRNEEDWVNN